VIRASKIGAQKLLNAWLPSLGTGTPAPATNAGRKVGELLRLTEHSPVLVWLVAESTLEPLGPSERG
jgi:hypothetical protein